MNTSRRERVVKRSLNLTGPVGPRVVDCHWTRPLGVRVQKVQRVQRVQRVVVSPFGR